MAGCYRSYVVRIRRPLEGDAGIRLDLEDLLGGRQVAVTGDEARLLANRLDAIVDAPRDGAGVRSRSARLDHHQEDDRGDEADQEVAAELGLGDLGHQPRRWPTGG